MYTLYIWYPWDFGKWIFKGEFSTKSELMKQISNKKETTYKITQNDVEIEYHKASSNCWRYGMIQPKDRGEK